LINLAVDIADKVVTIVPHVAVSHNPLPLWLQCEPLGSPGHRWFWPVIIAQLIFLAWLIFGWDPGSASHDDVTKRKDY
jgi:hypothetical protein